MARPLHIAYLPLDDRPVNLDSVYLLARMAGVELVLPPTQMLGSFTRPGDVDELRAWVIALPPSVTQLIVSLDMLCHGGLLASRVAPDESAAAPADQARAALECLVQLRKARPTMTISALGILLRSSISVLSDDDVHLWELIHDLATRPYATHESLPGEMESAGVPPETANAYLRTRARNLAVHQAALELVARDVIDYLLLCQEDAGPYGIHREEQSKLDEQIAGAALGAKVSIQSGADEAGMLLLARAAVKHFRIGLGIVPEFGPGGPGAVPLYEDATLFDTLRAKLATISGKRGFGTPFYVHVTEDEAYDLFMLQRKGETYAGFEAGLGSLGSDCAVADVSVANGADPAFMRQLLAKGPPFALPSFAAWNTAANTIGTVVAHLAMREIGKGILPPREAARLSLDFLATRFADDYLYQSDVRGRLVAAARERGLSVFNLGPEGHAAMEQLAQAEMEVAWRRFFDEHARKGAGPGLRVVGMRAKFSLPWPRLFEVRARIQIEVG